MKIKTDKKYYDAHNGKVYINGKRRCNTIMRPETHTFEEALHEINSTFNKYGILSKCDRIVGLFKRGYEEFKVRKALQEQINLVGDENIRFVLAKSYTSQLQRIKGC